jgi:hypothetical protein
VLVYTEVDGSWQISACAEGGSANTAAPESNAEIAAADSSRLLLNGEEFMVSLSV